MQTSFFFGTGGRGGGGGGIVTVAPGLEQVHNYGHMSKFACSGSGLGGVALVLCATKISYSVVSAMKEEIAHFLSSLGGGGQGRHTPCTAHTMHLNIGKGTDTNSLVNAQ